MSIHTKGGSTSPYEKFHLNKQARDNASRLASNEQDGLMPKELYAQSEQVLIPASSSDTGLPGQWAADSAYVYYCVEVNTWIRIELDIVEDLGYILADAETGEDPFTLAFEDGELWNAEVPAE